MCFGEGSLVYESEEAEDFMLVLQEGSIRVTDVNGANVAMLEIGHVIGALLPPAATLLSILPRASSSS